MKALNLSSTAPSTTIKVPADRISRIASGQRNISADTALRLGKLFSTGPQFWMNLQTAYELDVLQVSGRSDLDSIVPLVTNQSVTVY